MLSISLYKQSSVKKSDGISGSFLSIAFATALTSVSAGFGGGKFENRSNHTLDLAASKLVK